MVGALLRQMRKDATKFVSSGGFSVDITLISKEGLSVDVTGLATGTWIAFDDTSEGRTTGSQSDSLTLSEESLTSVCFPYKDEKGRIKLKDCKVIRKGAGTLDGSFIITEVHPNNSTGLLICILGRTEWNHFSIK